MNRSLAISGTLHGVILLWGLVAFAIHASDAPRAEPVGVEFVTDSQLSQLAAGVRNAPKPVENAKPLADKIGDRKLVKELAPKVVDKPEIRTDSAPPPTPKQEPKAQPKVAEKSEPKPDPKPEPKPKQAEKAEQPKSEPKSEPKPDDLAEKKEKPKPDQVAEELKKDEAKKPPKPEKKPHEFKPDQIAETLKKEEAKKPRQTQKFDADQVAALLDHREAQRQFATSDTLNSVASLGAPSGSAAHLSQNEMDALRARLNDAWVPPPATRENPLQYRMTAHIRLGRDRRLVGRPEILGGGTGPLFEATRDTITRALVQGQPYDMLSQTTYEDWKEMDIDFNPKEAFGG
jgi:outer membrane biosynthesis protein TonB